MLITIRPATLDDEPFLWEMLYQAIYTRPGAPPAARQIIERPELSRYVSGWGGPDDVGLIAEDGGQPVGAAWLRLMPGDSPGYGYVDDQTPELTMALLPDYRGQGVGTRLLARLLADAARYYPAVCLSVAAENPARRLYERHGFVPSGSTEDSLTMIRHFGDPPVLAAITSA